MVRARTEVDRERDRRRHQTPERQDYVRGRRALRKGEAQRLCDEAKSGGCVRCGATFDDLRVLEFHHRDPSEKTDKVSNLLMWSVKSWLAVDRVREEIEKCDVLCPTCHKIEDLAILDARVDGLCTDPRQVS